jgi:hypothetical protein
MNVPIRLASRLTKRRGLLAGAAALVGSGLTALTQRSASAGHNTNIAYDSQTTMHLDVTNTTAGSTRISSNISGTAAFVALNNYPVGISRPDGMLGRTKYTTSNCAGVAGTCENATRGIGVMGAAKSATGVGVYGFAGSVVPSTLGPDGTGVYGNGPSFGLFGTSTNGVGARGTSQNSVAVYGESNANFGCYGHSNGSIGVVGEAVNGEGVYGVSTNNVGVRGDASTGAGVLGLSNIIGVQGQSGAGLGVYGFSTANSGVVGETTSGLAGEFRGDVFVTGSLTAASKSAYVPLADGSVRRLYCMEAPEAVFEDFGEAKLGGGKASVALDGEFGATVRTDAYQVFLTPYGECRGLYVASRSSTGFEVRELGGGTSDLGFGYRIVAKRKDPRGTRLEKVNVPTRQITASSTLPARPKLPDMKLPDLSGSGTGAADEKIDPSR